MIYTSEQQHVIEEAVNWYRYSSEQVFQFDGFAGTGKSVVLNAIVDRLRINRQNIAPMAYIGQAAIVMRLKGFKNAKTIHSWLYNPVDAIKLDKNGSVVMNKYFNRPETTLGFEPKPFENIDLVIVDEGGTVPDGQLKYELESRGVKILVAGDLGQLPPITGKPAYLHSGKIHHLTIPMRQNENSGIYYLSNRARNGLPIQKGFYGDALVIDEDELNDLMIMNSDIVITGRNATRDRINKRVRHDIMKINTDLPMQGEKLICRKNNWNVALDGINLANGLIGRTVNHPGVEGFDGKNFTLDFKPDLLNNYFKGIPCDYNYFIAPYHEKQMLKNNKYSKGEKFEFANAITCHLSQGGQFHSGIYIEESLDKNIQNNLNYTGITRFTNGLIYVKRKKKFFFSR